MPQITPSRLLLYAALAGLLAWSVALTFLSGAFAYERDVLDKPVLVFVLTQSGAGAIYLLALWQLKQVESSRGLIAVLLAVGLVMRLSQFAATPILEDDYSRYLWDGAVSAHAINPYAHAPEAVRRHDSAIPDSVLRLGEEADAVLERVNHPSLRTIYPPTAQAMFAIGYWIKPFDIQGLRWTWLGLDLVIAGMLLVLLRGSTHAAWNFAVYWLNPLLIKEVFNSGHMELVVIATLLATLLAVVFRRWLIVGFTLGLAVGAKIWPMLWAPLLLRHVDGSWKRRLGVVVVVVITAAVLLAPMLTSRLDHASGLTAYAERWQMNDSAFMVIHETAKLLVPSHAQIVARSIVGLILLGVMIAVMRRRRAASDGLIPGALAVTAALFLLSPTQFSWYYLWILPLLALRPRPSLLALTVTLPMYYLRFPLSAMGHAAWFDYGLIWIEFAPVWLMLGLEGCWSRRPGPTLVEQSETLTCSTANA